MPGSGLSHQLPPALSHGFLALCFCFCPCSLFSALQSLSPLCPELSKGFHLTLRKSQSIFMGPKAPRDIPDPASAYFQPPTHTSAQATWNSLLFLETARHSTVSASALGLALSGMFLPDTCMAHCFASSGLS